jgi:hypothetical protein
MVSMKTGVKASDLRHAGKSLVDRLNRREIVRLVQRRERNQFFQLSQNLRSDHYRLREVCAAVDHPMAHSEHARAGVLRSKPECEGADRIASVLDGGGV